MMEPRKIQRVGKSTLTVSLPSEWTKNHSIDKGDHVYLSESGNGSVTVYPRLTGTVLDGSVRIDADGLSPTALERAVVGSYALGRNRITVESSEGLSDEKTGALYDAESQLIGTGIVEEGGGKVVLRCSINHDGFSANELISRLDSTGKTMRKETVEALAEGDTTLAERAAKRERQANKVFVLILRLVLTAQQNPILAERIGLDGPLHLVGTRAAAKSFERLADYAEEAANCAAELLEDGWSADERLVEGLEELVSLTDETCEATVSTLGEGDIECAAEARSAFENAKEIESRLSQHIFETERDPRRLTLLNQLLSALVESSKEAIDVAEVSANRALESSGEDFTVERGEGTGAGTGTEKG
jgi:phosphate uptake regulator